MELPELEALLEAKLEAKISPITQSMLKIERILVGESGLNGLVSIVKNHERWFTVGGWVFKSAGYLIIVSTVTGLLTWIKTKF